ncbi:polysaccharide biosynthesis tyrosine autokinase [Kiritimatiellota bacterium B12222]|nr:polysaccharide biosynthesis tyrosine autokinase [Kiritimatiellota bacterium B12222]
MNQSPYGEYPVAAPPPPPQSIGPASYGPYSGYGYSGNPYASGQAAYGYSGYSNKYGGYDYGNQAAEFLSPRRLIKVLRRRWFLIMMMLVLGAAAATLYYWKAERVYRSTALIEMSVRGSKIMNSVVNQEYGKSEEVFNTRLGRLRGDFFNMKALERFQILWDTFGNPTATDETPEFGEISYNMLRQSRLVQITAESNNAVVAAISANAAAEAAQEFFEDENRQMSDAAVEWLNRSAAVQKQQLTDTENKLLDFRKENKLDTLQAEQNADRQSLLTLNEMMINYDTQLMSAQEFLKTIDDVSIDLEEGVKLPTSLPNREVIMLEVQRYRAAIAQRELLLESRTEFHPDVQQLDLRIQEITHNIQQEVELSKSSFSQQIKILKGQYASVQSRIEELTDKVTRQELFLVERQARLKTLMRERDASESAFNNVLSRIEQARLAADEDTATLKLVERATLKEEPVHPKLITMMPLGIFGGLALGFMLALTLEAVEDRIFSIAELEAEISSRIIGIIPHIAGGKRADLAMISLNQKFGQVAEAFNAVRVILDHVNNNRLREIRDKGHSHPGGHVVMFCSASPSEGKTVSATNVAITSARAGQKTLLIDCDMRRPRLAKVFEDGIQAKEGDDEFQYSLLHHLAKHGGKDFEKIILPGPTEHLDLMASLASSDINPADLLGGKDIRNLISWARKHYDRVIIDTPPIGLISDGLVISALSDGVVAVCRAGQTRHRALRHVLLQFKGVGSNVIGIIVNDFNMKKASEPLDVHYKDFASGYEKSVYKEQETKATKENA